MSYIQPEGTEVLHSFRMKGDPVADAVIKEIIEKGESRSVSKLFDDLISNHDYVKANLPEEVMDYFKETDSLPEWIDYELIKKGQAVFAENGPAICMLLLTKSLPQSYSCRKGAMVLFQTGRLTEGKGGSLERFTRRLMETSQFVMNACAPGAFEEGGAGIITTQKVRLIHATIRYYIQAHGRWDLAEYGVPINQEDLAGTLQSFSALVLEGLEQFGVSLTEGEKASYYHIWHVIGHLIGLDPALNPPTHQEGLKLGYMIFNDQQAGSPEGVQLTKAVIDFMESHIGGNVFHGCPEAVMRYSLGDEIADLLEIPKEKELVARITPRLTKVIFHEASELENRSHFFKKIATHLSSKVLEGMLHHFNDHKGIHFYIPPGLRENWGLTTVWESHVPLTPSIGGYRIGVEKKTSKIS